MQMRKHDPLTALTGNWRFSAYRRLVIEKSSVIYLKSSAVNQPTADARKPVQVLYARYSTSFDLLPWSNNVKKTMNRVILYCQC